MENKTKYITPFIMLFAGALAAIIMLVKQYELYRMLWTLLIVLVVFYVIGDVVRYLYASIRPKIIPVDDLDEMVALAARGQQIEESSEEEAEDENAFDESTDSEESEHEENAADSEEAYGDSDSSEAAGEDEEYTDEKLDEM